MSKKTKILIIIVIILFAMFLPSIIYSIKATEKADDMLTLDTSLNENDIYISYDNYASDMETIVEPYVAQYEMDGLFNSDENTTIHYRTYIKEDAAGNVVISNGFCESSEKYKEMIYYFLNCDYNVYIMDHRGQGYSTREEDNLSKVYVESFDEYVNDFESFMEQIVLPEIDDEPCFLFAHSMGGGIGTAVLEEHPEYFDKAVLNCPMIDPNVHMPKPLAEFTCNVMELFGNERGYVIGHYDFDYVEDFDIMAAGSPVRFDYYWQKMCADEYLQTYGATYGWLKACLYGTDEIIKDENLEKITCPVLVFEAENDTLVNSYGINHLSNVVENSTLVYVPGSKHETYTTDNDTLIPYFNTIRAFLK